MTTDPFVPPAAEGLPLAALDSATEGANRLDAWARDPQGRNFLAHALVQLARDGWLRQEPGEGFEPMRARESAPVPAAVSVPPPTRAADRGADLLEAADRFDEHAQKILKDVNDLAAFVAKARQHEAATWREAAETLRRLAAEAQQDGAQS